MEKTLNRLLAIHQDNAFTDMTNEQLYDTYRQTKVFLINYIDSIKDQDYYDLVELLVQLSLIVGQDQEAKTLLARLEDKFGSADSERVQFLKGILLECTEGRTEAIEYLNKMYQEDLLPWKRRLFYTKGTDGYVENLLRFLQKFPMDAETLTELAGEYERLGLWDEAIFALEEIILMTPFNYSVFARIGVDLWCKYNNMDAKGLKKNGEEVKERAVKNFARSVELNESFVDGWCGLYVVGDGKLKVLAGKKLRELKSDANTPEKDLDSIDKVLQV